jgi:hypothetical protein
MERLALLVAERSEEVVLVLARERPQAAKRLEALGGEGHDVPAAIVGVAPSLDEPLAFQIVEHSDELPAVVAQRIGDGALRLVRVLDQRDEDGVVVRVEARALVCLERSLLGGEAEALQQERRGSEELLGSRGGSESGSRSLWSWR